MGRLVVGTGEEVGGKPCFFIVFSTFLVALGKKNQPKSRKAPKRGKNSKIIKKTTKQSWTDQYKNYFDFGMTKI